MNTRIEAPSRNALIDTHRFSGTRFVAYVTTRRGMPFIPSTKSGMKVVLKKMNIVQKCTFARRSLKLRPVIFGTQ